ncbi:unnamed protein product, partial [Cyprideis torosa]
MIKAISSTPDERHRLFTDPGFRNAFKREWRKRSASPFPKALEDMWIVDSPVKSHIGKNFKELAKEENKVPEVHFMDLMAEYDTKIRWKCDTANHREKQRVEMLGHKHMLPGFNDSGAHNVNMAFHDGALQALRLSLRHPDAFPAEEAISRLTKKAADFLGIDAGELKPGKRADVAEAISWAWELLTEVYGVDPNLLYVTVFEGDADSGLEKDKEAFDLWLKHVPADRILDGNLKDNFWEMGEVGPCGPCSEIHIDLRPESEKLKQAGHELVNKDHPLVIEIWNLVFIQFNRKANGQLDPLPDKHIDTGMGFERLCMVLQNKQSNYDTDVFEPLIKGVEKVSQVAYGQAVDTDMAIRVVVDHLRAVSFAIADGQMPSNTGAGYVIRRILRRAISYAYRFLNLKQPFLYELSDLLVEQFKDVYKGVKEQQDLIKNILKEEEQSFLHTIEGGMQRIHQIIASKQEQGEDCIEGQKLFELYDTFGFPLDLSQIIAREKNMDVDIDGFEKELEKQRERSRHSAKLSFGDWMLVDERDLNEPFTGYDHLEDE